MKTIIYCLTTAFLLCAFDAVQERKIRGKVTTASGGAPIREAIVELKGTGKKTVTDKRGDYAMTIPASGGVLVFSAVGYVPREIRIGKEDVINVQLAADVRKLSETVVSKEELPASAERRDAVRGTTMKAPPRIQHSYAFQAAPLHENTEEYESQEENIFHGVDKKPLSTFSIDVDAASYSNLRRFINNGERPPRDAVRIEEMINYFDYDYDEPSNGAPFNVYTEISQAPWNAMHHLVHIGLQGKRISVANTPDNNLVFLVDVSGSMNQANKLPLVKKSLRLLVDQLRAGDHVAMVVYAGAAGVVLEPASGDEKRKIIAAIDQLQAGGSTAGGTGLRMAYALARQHYKAKGNNRVILATDGDFNVGESGNKELEALIEEKRREGVYLTVLGYGMGNLKDAKMEILADKGNGNYAYIDNINEARKVLVNEFVGTMFTIATDVKLQVEFNPSRVQAYRLIGYENRKLNDEDFNNDKKDAGDLGSGHTVTALYEIIPTGIKSSFYNIDNLKYQEKTASVKGNMKDWLTVKVRYKMPGQKNSQLLEKVVSGNVRPLNQTSDDFRWSASVAAFGMLLRDSEYLDAWGYEQCIALAKESRGSDEEGYRSEFINLLKSYGVVARMDSTR